MKKTELMIEIAKKENIPFRKAERIVNHLFDVIGTQLRHSKSVCVTGFGTFKAHTKKGGIVSFGDGIRYKVPTMQTVHFTCGDSLKNVVRRKAKNLFKK